MCQVNENDKQESTTNNVSSANSTREKSIGRVNFETALAEIKFGKFNYFLMIVAGLVLSSVLFETLGISYVLPVTDCDLNFTTKEKGVLSAVGFFGIITSSHLWGFLADTKGRRYIIRPTLIIAFITTLISSFLNNFWSLVVMRYLNGFFISGGSATIYAYLGEFHSNKIRSKAIMGASVIFGLSALLMPAIAWLVINQSFRWYIPFLDITYKPWRLFMVVCGLLELICALCFYIIPESPKFTLLQNEQEKTMRTLRLMYAINTGKKGEEYPFTEIYEDEESNPPRRILSDKTHPIINTFISMWRQTIPLFQTNLLRITTLACTMQFLVFMTANGMYMWFPDILNQIGQYRNMNPDNRTTICEIVRTNKQKIAYNFNNSNNELLGYECKETLDISTYQYSLILELLYSISFALIGFIINAVGKIPILFVLLVGCGACGIGAAYVTDPVVASYLFLILMLTGVSTIVVNAATVDLFPTSLRGMAVCVTLMIGRLGSVVGANVFGILLDYDCNAAFLFSGIKLIICGFLGFFIPSKLKSRTTRTNTTADTATTATDP